MQYRSGKHGEQLSVLGFGCMRFSMKGGRIELEKARAEILRAYELGVNYFDTAYLYTGSEDLVGRVLRQAGKE